MGPFHWHGITPSPRIATFNVEGLGGGLRFEILILPSSRRYKTQSGRIGDVDFMVIMVCGSTGEYKDISSRSILHRFCQFRGVRVHPNRVGDDVNVAV